MSQGLRLYIDFCVFLLGAAIGSFLNVCIHRMPREESLITPPSHCPHCHERIRWTDNIPLLSYLALGGRCRHCRTRITPRYFLVELLTAGLFLWIHLRYGGWLTPIYWVFVAGLIASTFIDFEHLIIPDELTLFGMLAGWLCSGLCPALMQTDSHEVAMGRSLLGSLTGGLVVYAMVEAGKLVFGRRNINLEAGETLIIADAKLQLADENLDWADIFQRPTDRIRCFAKTAQFNLNVYHDVSVTISHDRATIGEEEFAMTPTDRVELVADEVTLPREAMGFGDVKFMGAIGAFLGWKATLFTLVTSSFFGGFIGLALVLIGRKDWQSRIPYGPYLALGALLWLLRGTEIVKWYVGLLGS